MLAELAEGLQIESVGRTSSLGESFLENLVVLVRKDPSAFELLLKEFHPLIRSLAKKCSGISYDTRDEVVQVLSIELWNAVKAFDTALGVPFRKFAGAFLRKRFNSWLRLRLYTKKMQFNFRLIRIESMEDGHDFIAPDKIDPVMAKFLRESFYEELSDVMKERLTPLEQQVFALWCKHHTYEEISRQLEVHVKTIDNAMTRVKIKLRKDKSLRDALKDYLNAR